MKNLKTVTDLSKSEMQSIKGGLRFETYNEDEYDHKMEELENAGHNPDGYKYSMCHGRKHYCIEW